jgi:hypothetical protein
MTILNGIKNFLEFINQNWTVIIVIIGLVIALAQKIKSYLSKSRDEKVKIAKTQIQEIILKLVTDAEIDYEEWSKSGSIKRAQVISQIYSDYPILSKVVDQQSLTEWIDGVIDTSLDTLREIVAMNTKGES